MFSDRVEAGRRLAQHLQHLEGREDVVVLGLPRGGVPVAREVATALGVPLDVIVVRKLGVPYQPELAMGAIGEGDVRIVDQRTLAMAGVSEQELEAVERRERAELERRADLFRRGRERVPLEGRVAVIVDDGIATGATIRAAARVARALGAARVVLAAPVAPADVEERLFRDADEVVVVEKPYPFYAIGQFYLDFTQTTDDEVIELLERGATPAAAGSLPEDPPGETEPGVDEDVEVLAGRTRLEGRLSLPVDSKGTVVFVHGSGSSRHSPRNRHVARALNRAGLGTLLFDLLTPDEELDRANVFDIELLADRLIEVTGWLTGYQAWSNQPIGYFGASTGAAAALWAAAELGTGISAIVSRGGRPDLTGPRLAEVRAPTLLIVGGLDTVVLDMNRSAQAELRCESTLEVVPGATHLFEEPGALDQVAELARHWFTTHFLGSGAVKIGGALRDRFSPSPAKEADNVTEATERDPSLERAREEAEGTELLERPERGGSLEREREEAQGVEVFADPDATLPATALREGSPGHEILTGNSVGLGPDDETNRVAEEEDAR